MIHFNDLITRKESIAVVGLGYVGLPLAVAFSKYFKVIGFDINKERIEELKNGMDNTREVDSDELKKACIEFSAEPASLKRARLIIVAVPTPIDNYRRPNLAPVINASISVGQNLQSGSVVVYESTVYPGVTEEECVPILERESGLKCGQDFWVGYSPERINPGDKVHTLETIVKVVAGQNNEVTELLARVYGQVVKAGIQKASSIKVAEAAKVIENTQRDLNIALMNELAMIFDLMSIDTLEVLEAAGTKWNFLPFRPGLVGGHCIGVDPYYLTFKAEALGYHPQVILAGRRINDNMGKYVAEKTVKELIKQNCLIGQAKVGILGLTFKENVPDLRNSKVIDIITELSEYCLQVVVHDPLAHPEEAKREYGVNLLPFEEMRELDAVVLAVPHQSYKELSASDLARLFKNPQKGVLVDVRGLFNPDEIKKHGLSYWRL